MRLSYLSAALIISIFTIASCKKHDITKSHNAVLYASSLFNYYVDGTNGNDRNDGLSLTTAWKTIQKSFDSAKAGSIVSIRGGTYYEQLAVHVSGNAGTPITFTSYNNEPVIIDGSKITGTTILTISDKSYLAFSHLTIQNITKNNAQGILVTASKNGGVNGLSFIGLTIKNIQWTTNATTIPTSNDNAQAFIAYGYGAAQANAITNITIDSCELSNNITGFSESLSLDGNVDGFAITNNKVHDNSNIGILAAGHYGTSSTASLDQARNGVINGNICLKNISPYATSGGIYIDGARDTKIERNLCSQNGYGIEVGNELNGTASNITVANNILTLNQVAGLAFGGYDTKTTGQVINCTFRNNTFFKNNTNLDGSGEVYITKASNCTVGNNVFYTNSQNTLFSLVTIVPQSGNAFNYNCWFTEGTDSTNIQVNWNNTSYYTFSDYRTGTQQDAKSFFGDPKFISQTLPDYHLQSGSPCIKTGNGAWITDPAETDFDGKPRLVNGTVDMGAYQKQ